MMYAVQGNVVRWFFSPEEDDHLFAAFKKFDTLAEVVVKGNWNEGLLFTPLIRKSGPRTVNGSFPIALVEDKNKTFIKTITTPLDYLKISRQFISTIEPSASIVCSLTPERRELIVYPCLKQNLEQQDPQTTDTTEQSDIAQPEVSVLPSTSETVEMANPPHLTQTIVDTPVANPPADPVSDFVTPTATPPPQHSETVVSERPGDAVSWAKELVDEINSLIARDATISVATNSSNKELKIIRRVVKRRQIV